YIVVRIPKRRVHLDGLHALRNCLLNLPLEAVHPPPKRVPLRSRIRLNGLRVQRHRLVQLPPHLHLVCLAKQRHGLHPSFVLAASLHPSSPRRIITHRRRGARIPCVRPPSFASASNENSFPSSRTAGPGIRSPVLWSSKTKFRIAGAGRRHDETRTRHLHPAGSFLPAD